MKYECLKSFTDKYDSSIHYEKGKIYEFTPERAKEILAKDTYIRKVKTTKKSK